MESIEVFREVCDNYYEFERGVIEPGRFRTYVNIQDMFFEVNKSAQLALDFYNRINQKKFNLVKVCKHNYGGPCKFMIFCAQDDGSDERRLFRCVVDAFDGVLLCEIKDNAEISNLVDHVDDYLQKLGERDEDLLSGTCKDDLGDNSAPGSDGVILVSPTMFRIMGEKSFSDLHKMCDDYMDPCLYEKCEMMTSVCVKCFDWVTEYAKVAINFYNKKEQKNFSFVQVERLYTFCCGDGYCMIFWARNGTSDEFRLFRAIPHEVDHEDDDKITIPAEQDNAWVEKLNESDELCLPFLLSSPNIRHKDPALVDNTGVDTVTNSTLVISCSDNTSDGKNDLGVGVAGGSVDINNGFTAGSLVATKVK